MEDPVTATNITYFLTNGESFNAEIKIYNYTEKSIAMISTEHFGKAFAEQLKINGKYNAKLRMGKGWIFPKSKYANLQNLVAEIIEGKIKGEMPMEFNKTDISSISGPLGNFIEEPAMVADFKKLINKLSETRNKTIFNINDKTYIWGENEAVDSSLIELNKTPTVIMKTKTHSFVIGV